MTSKQFSNKNASTHSDNTPIKISMNLHAQVHVLIVSDYVYDLGDK